MTDEQKADWLLNHGWRHDHYDEWFLPDAFARSLPLDSAYRIAVILDEADAA